MEQSEVALMVNKQFILKLNEDMEDLEPDVKIKIDELFNKAKVYHNGDTGNKIYFWRDIVWDDIDEAHYPETVFMSEELFDAEWESYRFISIGKELEGDIICMGGLKDEGFDMRLNAFINFTYI